MMAVRIGKSGVCWGKRLSIGSRAGPCRNKVLSLKAVHLGMLTWTDVSKSGIVAGNRRRRQGDTGKAAEAVEGLIFLR